MSELKVVKQSDVLCGHWSTEYYLKSEADKVIADLEESHKKEVGQLLMAIVELKKERNWLAKDRAQAYSDLEKRAQLNIKQEESIRHHKYKRCLAMASRCFTKSNYHFVLARHGEDGKENNRKSILYSKWRKRWLAIAEKFKPNSTLQQKD